MEELLKQLLNPELIRAAASSTLGILCLMCVILAAISLTFFRDSPIWARLTVFVLLFAGVAGFGYATAKQSSPQPVIETVKKDNPIYVSSIDHVPEPEPEPPVIPAGGSSSAGYREITVIDMTKHKIRRYSIESGSSTDYFPNKGGL